MPSALINATTQSEWRELGFYYDRDDDAQVWRLLGTKEGLLGFVRSLKAYASDESKLQISEHEHFGPYRYLEVGTWHTPEITEHWIAGPQTAILALAHKLEHEILAAQPASVIAVRESFAPDSPYELQLEIQPDGFDPARQDPECWDEA